MGTRSDVILVLPEGGLGNKTEALGVYQSLAAHYGPVDMFDLEPEQFSEFFAIDELHSYRKPLAMRNRHANLAMRMTYTFRSCTQSEVKDNERILKRMNVKSIPVEIPWDKIHPASLRSKKYDVVICNGGMNNATWMRKRYQKWNEVVSKLKTMGYSVACIGRKNEYIYDAVDLTEIGLIETINILNACKVFASNDSGFFHVACALNKPTVCVFTATNPYKNTDKIFHRSADIIVPNLSCFPCQGREDNLWVVVDRWNSCNDWKCTGIDSDIVVKQILRRLN
jgi:ADP-heptose:LPS heptosyltransferase